MAPSVTADTVLDHHQTALAIRTGFTRSEPLPIDDVVNNDLAITASFGYTSAVWAEVAGLFRAGKIHLAPLITHRFPLEAFPDAYRTLRAGTGPRGKVLLEVNPI